MAFVQWTRSSGNLCRQTLDKFPEKFAEHWELSNLIWTHIDNGREIMTGQNYLILWLLFVSKCSNESNLVTGTHLNSSPCSPVNWTFAEPIWSRKSCKYSSGRTYSISSTCERSMSMIRYSTDAYLWRKIKATPEWNKWTLIFMLLSQTAYMYSCIPHMVTFSIIFESSALASDVSCATRVEFSTYVFSNCFLLVDIDEDHF